MELYKNIRSRRQELGLTQTELAHKVGYADKSMIAKIEAGKVNLSRERVLAFADALMLPAGDLMGWNPAAEAAALFDRLDETDQGRILGRMEEMLEADKYKTQEGYSEGKAIS